MVRGRNLAKTGWARCASWMAAGLLACLPALLSAAEGDDRPSPAGKPGGAGAASVESLLPADASAYVRFDGLEANADAFAQTSLGKLLSTDAKPLVDLVYRQLVDSLGPGFLTDQLLSGSRPEDLLELQELSATFPLLIERLLAKGAAVTFESINPLKPRLQLTVVFPDVANDADQEILVGSFRLLALVSRNSAEMTELHGRQVWQFQIDNVRFALWREGSHMVATFGTEPPAYALAVIDGTRPSLETSELLAMAQTPVAYPTCARGFVNVKGILSIVNEAFPPAQLVVTALGLHNLETFAFQYGFEGKFQRATSWMKIPGERKGLVRLLTSTESIELDRLPALPPNATMIYTTRLPWTDLYDDTIQATKSLLSLAVPFGTPDVDGTIDQFNKQLGVDLRNDLIGALGENLVIYDAPDHGPYMMGTVLAIEVRDEARMQIALDKLMRALHTNLESRPSMKMLEYRGAKISILDSEAQGVSSIFMVSFTIHRGWLVASLFPHSVKGFVYRNGDYPARRWEPVPRVQESLRVPGNEQEVRLAGFSMTDPRPAIRETLSALPLYINTFRSFTDSDSSFDASLLPPAQAITDLVEPGFSVTFDNGDIVRSEWQSTIPFPTYVNGLNLQLMFLLSYTIGF